MQTTNPSASYTATIDLPRNDAVPDKSYSDLIVIAAICVVGLAFSIGLAWFFPIEYDLSAVASVVS